MNGKDTKEEQPIVPAADLGRAQRLLAEQRGISYRAWQAIAEGALLGGQARLWVDLAPPQSAVRMLPGNGFAIDDEDWRRIEKLLGLTATAEEEQTTGDYLLDLVIGAPRTPRSTLTSILRWHVTERAFRVSIPELAATLKRRLKKLDVAQALFAEAMDDETDFLKEIFVRERGPMRNPNLALDEEVSRELELLWEHSFSPKQILFSITVYRQNVERALQVLPSAKPTDWNRKELGRRLAVFWTDVTGAQPTSGRDPMNNSKQTGPFAEFYRIVNGQLPEEFRIPDIENAIREAVKEAAST